MKAKRKLWCVLSVVMLFISGCNINGAQNAPKSLPSSTPAVTTPPSSNVINNLVSSKIPITISKIGKPIKASKMFADAVNIYYISPTNNEIYSINKNMAFQYSDGSFSPTQSNVGKVQYINESASEFLVSNNIIYYTNMADGNRIYTVGTNGQNRKKLVDEPAHNMVLIGNYLYYLGDDNYLRVFDTSSGTTYLSQLNTMCFDSDGTNIYYEVLNFDGSHSLNAVKIDGSGAVALNNDFPTSIVVNNGKVFYTNGGDNQILYYTTTDGKSRVKFTDVGAGNFLYSGGYIYYTNKEDSNNLYKVYYDGSRNTKLIADSYIASFIVDNGTIYFTRNIDNEDVVYKISG